MFAVMTPRISNPTVALPRVQATPPELSFGSGIAPAGTGFHDTLSFGGESQDIAGAFSDFASGLSADLFGDTPLSLGQTESPSLSFGDIGDATVDPLAVSADGLSTGTPVPSANAEQAQQAVRATGESNLGRGNAGAEVRALQEMLEENGYNVGDSGADGIFGPDTEKALKAFQHDQRNRQIEEQQTETPEGEMAVDGILGPQTREALASADEARRDEIIEAVEGEPVVEPGADGAVTGGEVDALEGPEAGKSEAVSRVEASIARDPSIAKEEGPGTVGRTETREDSSAERAEKADEAAGGEAASGGTSV